MGLVVEDFRRIDCDTVSGSLASRAGRLFTVMVARSARWSMMDVNWR